MTSGEPREIATDINVDGTAAFRRGEQVIVERTEPNPQRPEYRHVVFSQLSGRWFQLRDRDLTTPQVAQQADGCTTMPVTGIAPGGPADGAAGGHGSGAQAPDGYGSDTVPGPTHHFAPGDVFQQGAAVQGQDLYGNRLDQPQGYRYQQGHSPPAAAPARAVTLSGQGAARLRNICLGLSGLGFLVIVSTFLPWLSVMGLSVGSGWNAMLHGGSGGGFSVFIRGEGVLFFTGFWSLAAGVAIIVGAVILYTGNMKGAWVGRIAGSVGAACALVTTATILFNTMSPGYGLLIFTSACLAAGIISIMTFKWIR
jgi:hypothetical protein